MATSLSFLELIQDGLVNPDLLKRWTAVHGVNPVEETLARERLEKKEIKAAWIGLVVAVIGVVIMTPTTNSTWQTIGLVTVGVGGIFLVVGFCFYARWDTQQTPHAEVFYRGLQALYEVLEMGSYAHAAKMDFLFATVNDRLKKKAAEADRLREEGNGRRSYETKQEFARLFDALKPLGLTYEDWGPYFPAQVSKKS